MKDESKSRTIIRRAFILPPSSLLFRAECCRDYITLQCKLVVTRITCRLRLEAKR
jgi:hypothetical protein